MLQAAIENEVGDYLAQNADVRDEAGRKAVVRNGHIPARDLATGVGPPTVKQPRVRDRREVLRDLKARGLEEAPKLAVGDGALGFWGAMEEEFPQTRQQRCWVHKTANVLDKLPKRVQPYAKKLIHEMYLSPTRDDALKAHERFCKEHQAKYPKAVACLEKDKHTLFTFYDFPAEHWAHLRTTNPIESTFATVRHRTRQTKGCGSRRATLTMVFKLATQAEKHWRRLNGHQLIPQVIQGVVFKDGTLEKAA
jgi:transposase-like protein